MLTLEAATASRTEALRARLVRDGYLYLPGFLDGPEIVAAREQICAGLAGVGWLADPGGTRVSRPGLRFDRGAFRSVYPVVQRMEDLHRLAHDPRLMRLMRDLLGTEVFCQPAKAVRIIPPTSPRQGYATRAHQDFVVQHVSADVLTAWVAFTPCDVGRPGLWLMPGSHHHGFLPTDPTVGGTRPIYLDVPPEDPRWASVDYAPGDVVVFHSLTIHAAGPNRGDEFRLSLDLRYQPCDDPMRTEFAHPHGWPVTPDWPTLWTGWSSREWVAVPPGVELVPLPEEIDYGRYLRTVRVPASRLPDRQGACP